MTESSSLNLEHNDTMVLSSVGVSISVTIPGMSSFNMCSLIRKYLSNMIYVDDHRVRFAPSAFNSVYIRSFVAETGNLSFDMSIDTLSIIAA